MLTNVVAIMIFNSTAGETAFTVKLSGWRRLRTIRRHTSCFCSAVLSYREPRTGKEYGPGRIKRDAVNQAIDANIPLMDVKREKLTDRIASYEVILFHDWLDCYNKIILSHGLK
ncbi:phage integrase Arm DNA-binding domain-containing protein [Morganella morganii]|nr:hypothetical protein [Morganella morganii]